MEQIYYACANYFDWIEDRVGAVAAWTAAISVIVIFIGGIGIAIWLLARQ